MSCKPGAAFLAVVVSLSPALADTESSDGSTCACESSSSSSNPYAFNYAGPLADRAEQLCRHMSVNDATAEAERFGLSEKAWQEDLCYDICPKALHGERECSAHEAHHADAELSREESMIYGILFLALSVLLGAAAQTFISRCLPALPYTVGLLLAGMTVGAVSMAMHYKIGCPMLALDAAYDSNGDRLITPDEWARFNCSDCDDDSLCASRTRGAGSSAHSFDDLDRKYKLVSFDAAHQKVDDGEGDGVLTPNELWLAECDLMHSAIQLANMDPHMLLVVFLPALLFESAFALDIATFSKQLPQIVLLAFPGVLISSLLTGLLVWALYPDWKFAAAWLLGTILSATDPVAVVALLKEVGAAKTLGTLIEGESLLNDGSAIVLFQILYTFVMRDELEAEMNWSLPVECVRVFVQMALFGVALGWIFGYLTARALQQIYNVMIVEVAIVLGSSYLLFWLAELYFKSSAVLAVVVMGLYLNREQNAISVEVHHFLHEFYEMLAYLLNTVIFLIAGIRLGEYIFSVLGAANDGINMSGFTQNDAVIAIIIYIGIMVARSCSLLILYPALKRLGTGMDWRTATIVMWGGLRGSVGLALGLIVFHDIYQPFWTNEGNGGTFSEGSQEDDRLDCRDVPQKMLFHTVCIVLFTVTINGSTVAKLLHKLGLDSFSDDRKLMLYHALRRLDAETTVYMDVLRKEVYMEMVDWDHVRRAYLYDKLFDIDYMCDHSAAALQQALNIEKMKYVELHEKGEISDKAASRLDVLMSSLQVQLMSQIGEKPTADNLYQGVFDRILLLLRQDDFSGHLRRRFQDYACLRWYAEPAIFDDLQLGYEMGKAFIKAQETLSHVLEEEKRAGGSEDAQDHRKGSITGLAKLRMATREIVDVGRLVRSTERPAQPPPTPAPPSPPTSPPGDAASGAPSPSGPTCLLSKSSASMSHSSQMPASSSSRAHLHGAHTHLEAFTHAVEVRKTLVRKMDKEVRSMGQLHHDVSQVVETRYAANLILRRQRHIVEEMKHHGELIEGDAANLTSEITAKLKEIYFSPPTKFGVKDDEDVLLDQVPAFGFLKVARDHDHEKHGKKHAEDESPEHELHLEYVHAAQKLLQLLLDRKTARHYGINDVILSPAMVSVNRPGATSVKSVDDDSSGRGPGGLNRFSARSVTSADGASPRTHRAGPPSDARRGTAIFIKLPWARPKERSARDSGTSAGADADAAVEPSTEPPPSMKTRETGGLQHLSATTSDEPSGELAPEGTVGTVASAASAASGGGRDRSTSVQSDAARSAGGRRRSIFSRSNPQASAGGESVAPQQAAQSAWKKLSDAMLVVKYGLLRVASGEEDEGVLLGPGSLINARAVLMQDEREVVITCERPAEVIFLAGDVVRRAFSEFGEAGLELKSSLWSVLAKEIALHELAPRHPYNDPRQFTAAELREHVERASLHEYEGAEVVELYRPCLLVTGDCMVLTHHDLSPGEALGEESVHRLSHGNPEELLAAEEVRLEEGAAGASAGTHPDAAEPRASDDVSVATGAAPAQPPPPRNNGRPMAGIDAATAFWRSAPVLLRAGDRVHVRPGGEMAAARLLSLPDPSRRRGVGRADGVGLMGHSTLARAHTPARLTEADRTTTAGHHPHVVHNMHDLRRADSSKWMDEHGHGEKHGHGHGHGLSHDLASKVRSLLHVHSNASSFGPEDRNSFGRHTGAEKKHSSSRKTSSGAEKKHSSSRKTSSGAESSWNRSHLHHSTPNLDLQPSASSSHALPATDAHAAAKQGAEESVSGQPPSATVGPAAESPAHGRLMPTVSVIPEVTERVGDSTAPAGASAV